MPKYLNENLSKNFIRELKSRRATPPILTAKYKGEIPVCQNYKSSSNITIKNKYSIPLVKKTLEQIDNAKVFAKLDIIHEFKNIMVAKQYIQKQRL